LDARIIAEATNSAGIERWDVRFQTEPGEDITATLLLPPERRRHRLPAVLALHQTVPEGRFELVGRSDTLDIGYGWQLARRGFVVLAPDSLAAGDRVEPGQQPWYTSRFYQKHPTWSAIGKAIWDNQRALDYLASLPFVDSKRIGAIGHSQGGVYAMFLEAFDKRVKATFSNSGLITFSSDPNPLRWARDTFWVGMPLMRESLKRRSTSWDMHEVVALIAPRAFFATAAQADKTLPEAAASIVEVENSVKPLYAAYGRADALRTLLFPGEHLFPLENQLLAFEWLEQQLKAPLQR
jgi:hypothetical protein